MREVQGQRHQTERDPEDDDQQGPLFAPDIGPVLAPLQRTIQQIGPQLHFLAVRIGHEIQPFQRVAPGRIGFHFMQLGLDKEFHGVTPAISAVTLVRAITTTGTIS